MTRLILRLAAMFGSMAAALPAAAEWREASTDHFLIYADASEEWTRSFADKLERFDAAMRVGRGLRVDPGDKANRLIVYAVSDLDEVRQLYARGKASSVGGFYLPRVVSVAYTPRESGSARDGIDGQTVLFHEYTHHLMWRGASIAYPKWYSEGFAELYGAALIASDGRVVLGRPASHRRYSLLNATSVPLEQLFAGEDGGDGDRFYGRAWLLTHMLTFDPSRAGQLAKYLTLTSSGTSSLDAAKATFGDLRALDRALDTYMSRPLTTLTIPADRIKPGPITIRALTRGEALMMPVRMRSDRGVDAAEAKLVLADARRIAAPFPTDPGVQVVLAEAEYDAGNDAEADAAADRALAADAKQVDALLYKGQVALRRARKDKGADAETWRRARSWFIRAAAARPDAAEPLALFYQSYADQGAAPTRNAADALVRAHDLAPQDRSLRFAAARQMLHEGNVKGARRTLVPLAFDPHAKGESNFAAKLVKMIDAGEPAAKIASAKPGNASESDGGGSGKSAKTD